MRKIKYTFLLLITSIISSCVSEKDPMTSAEKYMANKYNAEWTDIIIRQTETKKNGKVTERREYIGVQILNSTDIDRILGEKDYARKRMTNVANFVLDSVDLGEMTFVPKEIEIEYLKEEGFIFQNVANQTMVFELDKT
ncbi:hypothetical protein [uncultured Maribacter sp.]|uniref:hypothetical protein n=1 Tax=uncultured Maribacter sp. TaxID=431308 RepID=UPI00261F64B0|nr:hypothetical protein [uncultured Maribacter sp.]